MRSERAYGHEGITRTSQRTEKLTIEERRKLWAMGGAAQVARTLRLGHETARELMSPEGMVTAATIDRVRAQLASLVVG